MRTVYDNESPSLVQLYGEDYSSMVSDVSRKTGASPEEVLDILTEYPELMGIGMGEEPKGAMFSRIFNTISQGVGAVAPSVADIVQKVKKARSNPTASVTPTINTNTNGSNNLSNAGSLKIDPMMIAGGLGGLALIYVIMQKKRKK